MRADPRPTAHSGLGALLLDGAGAAGLLTAIPLPPRLHRLPATATVAAFGIVGLALGSILGGLEAGLAFVLAPPARSAVLVAVLALLTGGLHLDGLGDTVDGLAARGPREERLAAMRDSRLGALGAASIAAILLVDVTALAAIPAGRIQALVVAVGCSRAAGAVALASGSPAHPDGLGRAYVVPHVRWAAAVAVASTAVAAGLLAGWRGIAAALLATATAIVVAAVLRRAVGGMTGDGCGAAIEVAAAVSLLCLGART